MVKHLNIEVVGRVQGVFFRHFTKKTADKLQVKGFIRNEPGGLVHIEAEGEQISLDKFLKWCRKGPVFARVDRVKVTEGKVVNYTDFKIL